MNTNPLISCLCITKNSAALLLRAIECFEAQTYENRELLVLYETDNAEIEKVTQQKKQTGSAIQFIEIPASPKQNLGGLRNLSIELCNGEFFSQWDDDDWYSADRLEVQLNQLVKENADVCFLGYWILFDHTNNTAYLSFKRNWEGTILCKKSLFNDDCKYALLPRAEDTAFTKAIAQRYVDTQLLQPWVYIYTYHGNNTWEYSHFLRNFMLGEQLSAEFAVLIKNILSGRFSVEESTKLLQNKIYTNEIEEKIKLLQVRPKPE